MREDGEFIHYNNFLRLKSVPQLISPSVSKMLLLTLVMLSSAAKFHKFYTNYTRLKEKGFWRRTARGNKEGEVLDHQLVHFEHFSNIFVDF